LKQHPKGAEMRKRINLFGKGKTRLEYWLGGKSLAAEAKKKGKGLYKKRRLKAAGTGKKNRLYQAYKRKADGRASSSKERKKRSEGKRGGGRSSPLRAQRKGGFRITNTREKSDLQEAH